MGKAPQVYTVLKEYRNMGNMGQLLEATKQRQLETAARLSSELGLDDFTAYRKACDLLFEEAMKKLS